MKGRLHGLRYEQASGGITLTQRNAGGEARIILHPEQLRFIARALFGPSPEAAQTAAELERRLAVLADKTQDIACDRHIRNEILDRCGSGVEILARLDALADLALEYDGGRLCPEECATVTESVPVTESVTPPVTDLVTPPQLPHPSRAEQR